MILKALLYVNCALMASALSVQKPKLSTLASTLFRITVELFPRCDLFVLTDRRNPQPLLQDLDHELETMLSYADFSYYNIRLDGRLPQNFINSSRISPNHESRFFPGMPGLSRLNDNCAFVILALETVTPELSQFLFRFLTPKHFEATRKDEDHYLFITPKSEVTELMLSKDFGSKIKYKAFISLEDSEPISLESVIQLKTMCFFCNSGGSKIVDLNMESSTLPSLFPDFIQDYNGSDFIAAISNRTHSRAEMWRDSEGNYHRKRGLYFLILDVLQERFNFKLKIVPSFGDGGTGLLLKNGTWLGSVANILHGTAHIGMVCAQTFQRNHVVGFAFSLQYEWITFTTGRPRAIHSWRTVYKPFSLQIWVLVTTSILGIILAFVVMRNFIPGGWKIGEIFNYIVGSMLEQSYTGPQDVPIITLCTFWLLFGIVISTDYRSKLFTFLVFPEKSVAPKTFDQLAYSDDYKWGLMYVAGAAYAVFATSTEKTYSKIFNDWELIPDFYECFNRTTQENFACISWQSISQFIAHKNFTDRRGRKVLVEAPASTYFIPLGAVLEKRAVFRTNFDKIIHWSHDTGLVLKWEDMDWTHVRKLRVDWLRDIGRMDRLDENGEEDPGPQPLGMQNLIGAWTILGIFLGISVAGFLLEWAWRATLVIWHLGRKNMSLKSVLELIEGHVEVIQVATISNSRPRVVVKVSDV